VFVAINCANFNSNILESELLRLRRRRLYRRQKGGKLGLFEAAGGGTLFLDEISELDLPLQPSCCAPCRNAASDRWAAEEVEVDVRIVAACKRRSDRLRRRENSARILTTA
jgi:transcriptional regulator with PAS, ATPase and Fis domain